MSRFKMLLGFAVLCLAILPVVVSAAEDDLLPIYDSSIYPIPERPTSYITTAPLNLRPSPSTSDTRIKLVQPGRMVEVIDFRDGEWFAVNVNGQTGYMFSTYLAQMPETGLNAIPGTVELVYWSTARNIIPQNTAITIIDVRTRTSIQMVSFSHGNHADVYPLTYADTEALYNVFCGWTWTPRPILVLVGDYTFAASMNGMPHGGGNNRSNGMNGHLCIHFQGSRTHNGNRSHEADHQRAVLEAFNTASAW